jgi:hypothetical protein
MATTLGIGSLPRRGVMSENDQKVEYVNALEEAQKLDDLLASIRLRLKKIGEQMEVEGRILAGGGSLPMESVAENFSRELFEQDFGDIPALLEQYKAAHAKRTALEEQLVKFSWHRNNSK